jgi:hypothetical protein
VKSVVPTVVVAFRAEHERGLFALWRRFFGDWSAERLALRWQWQYGANPWARERPPVIAVALHGGDVVGHIGGIPLPMRLDDARRIALGGSAMVLADEHRLLAFKLAATLFESRPVLGSGLCAEAMRLFRRFGAAVVPSSQRRFTYALSRAGALARRLRERVPSWCASMVSPSMLAPAGRVSMLARWAAPDRPRPRERPPIRTRADIRVLRRFGADYEALWDAARARYRCGLDKDATYMNWRYVDCPTLRPILRGLYRGDRLDAVLVALRRTELDWRLQPCVVQGEIAELIVRPHAVADAEALLERAVDELAGAGADEVTATGMHADLVPAFTELGFVVEHNDEFALGLCVDDDDAARVHGMSPEAWYTSAADGDALYAPGL